MTEQPLSPPNGSSSEPSSDQGDEAMQQLTPYQQELLRDPKELIPKTQEEVDQLKSTPRNDGDITMEALQRQAYLAAKHMYGEQQEHYKATHDDLTGLLNRAGLKEYLKGIEGRVSMVFADLTNVKSINDDKKLGHARGDKIIKDTADVLRASVREGDVIARVGGDEFVIVLKENPTSDDAEEKRVGPSINVDKTRERVAHGMFGLLGKEENKDLQAHPLDVATGGATKDPDEDINEVIGRAEQRMYAHKGEQHELLGQYRPPVGSHENPGSFS